MANERASNFWLEFGNERLAHIYWQQAYVCYSRWGAAAKVISMETAYREDLAKDLPDGNRSGNPAEKLEWEIKNVLVERQIKQLRNYVFQIQQTRLRMEAATQADELAHALQRLRVEISERKHLEEKLKEMSLHNALTGLYNRRFFDEEIARLGCGQQFPISIIMADLNGLKKINDSEGHAAGDAMLQRAAQVLKAAFRANDIIARLGGDEFAILLPDTDAASTEQSLRRLRLTLDKHNAAHDGPPLSIAFGVSTAEQGGVLTDTLKEADARMYVEKRRASLLIENQNPI